jgi:hypothetical protein
LKESYPSRASGSNDRFIFFAAYHNIVQKKGIAAYVVVEKNVLIPERFLTTTVKFETPLGIADLTASTALDAIRRLALTTIAGRNLLPLSGISLSSTCLSTATSIIAQFNLI